MLAWGEHSSRPVYIISVPGQSGPAGMPCQHDIFSCWATYIQIFFGKIHNIVTTTVTNSTNVEPVSIFISLNQVAVKITPAESFLWMHLHQFQYLFQLSLNKSKVPTKSHENSQHDLKLFARLLHNMSLAIKSFKQIGNDRSPRSLYFNESLNTLKLERNGHHFHMHFPQRKIMYFYLNLTEALFQGSNWH